jgi:hypothetical protein
MCVYALHSLYRYVPQRLLISKFFYFRVRVLCINNEFHGFEASLLPRKGNEADVNNLRQTFTDRGITFHEQCCKNRKEILNLFQTEENLLKHLNSQGSKTF